VGRGFGLGPPGQVRQEGFKGGDERTRTADPLLAKQVLYQLSYVPVCTSGNVEPRPCTRLRQWTTSQRLTDRAEMRDADMSVSTGQSVGDVRPRFISARRIASDEELELRAAGLAVKLGREQATSIAAPAASQRDRSTRDGRAELPTYLVGWWTGTAPDRFRRVRWPRSPIPARSGR
jgi:hypothetical protein